MSYLDQARGPSPAGLASSIIVQVAIGAAVIAGLTVSDFVKPEAEKEWEPIEYTLPPPPKPPEPERQPEAAQEPPSSTPVFTPPTKFDFEIPRPEIAVTDDLPPPAPPGPIPGATSGLIPTPTPSFSPVAAKARNNPAGWLSDRDYRTGWIRRELTGTASFRLDIARTGQVTGCQITRSTGHAELDEATCKLVQQRAKFEPARGSNGEPVAGSFSSTVRWVLPD